MSSILEMLKGSWNIFEKILSSGQMYLQNCQKFLGCFWNLAVIQKSLTFVSEKIGRYIPAHGQRRMGGHPVLGRHWKQCIPHFTLHLLFSVTSNHALSRHLVSWTVLCNQGYTLNTFAGPRIVNKMAKVINQHFTRVIIRHWRSENSPFTK